jgi:hypothetical protein
MEEGALELRDFKVMLSVCFATVDDVERAKACGNIIAMVTDEVKGNEILDEFWCYNRGLCHETVLSLRVVFKKVLQNSHLLFLSTICPFVP